MATNGMWRWLQLAVVPATALASFLLMRPRDGLVLACLALVFGGLLCWAFRASPGPAATKWQGIRAARDPQLYRFYSVSGPWLWRFGAGALAGTALRFVATGT